ncbi:MAG: thiol-disulfide isomerase/thioredoxin [Urechidicola sp.]|mgnify:CR=1 FL=1|jgi:thiol-disulfide isomerase/thioredoxin|tara:strand:+ start:3002 stop:4228 length:1227 start_codon:yes stop_codon:yes gene_type:complete
MKNTTQFIITLLTITLLFSCTNNRGKSELKDGFWRGEITAQENKIPFIFDVIKTETSYKINLHDGDNLIEINEVTVKNDSVFFALHIFDATIKAKINNKTLTGTYTKNYAEDYILPFKATFGKKNRLESASTSKIMDGKWAINLHKNDGTFNKTIGLFKTENDILKGTILTKTGDYRFLEGKIENDAFELYAFDGNHLFTFKGIVENDTLLKGEFWSGKTFYQKFSGRKDAAAKLPDSNKLTFLKEGFDKIEFSFPNLEGNNVSLNAPKYKDKVVVLQIFGTWCPNCMDETKFYADWYEKNKDRGVEIIGLAYENKDDFEYAKARVDKMRKTYNVGYDYLIAGTSNKGDASKTLPMLNHIMSFPTSIIIDKKGKVRNIHTGFSGPATGDYYLHYVEEFNQLMDKLLNE